MVTLSLIAMNDQCLSYSFRPTVPVYSFMDDVIIDAFIIAIVSFVINIAQAKLVAKKNGYSIHSDQVIACEMYSLFTCMSLRNSLRMV